VDIGVLDAVIMLGFPTSIASFVSIRYIVAVSRNDVHRLAETTIRSSGT
jgi:hypothetical protein